MKQAEGLKKTSRSGDRADGRKQLLVYMEPTLVRELKKAALDRDVAAFEIVEQAVKDWLQRNQR
ncbi:hypothetical protein ACM41_18325 [Bradyrhizobium sp. CCBAU 21362]|uniref:hypothetical protein n=1 Tax=Bradyrhizobium sp. CCBAU 21362 TaxID=1325082 RepID=UPI002305087A|nr:hypothetical protein [Bradyrhizobium sp. CCBAU 21362]MDA9538079.1 hypothetical protein [Bradyrhizobium sp. CCBAU 21362]